jgi:hypothetical protein
MGCSKSYQKRESIESLVEKIKDSIENDSSEALKDYLSIFQAYDTNSAVPMIDKPLISLQSMKLNALGYSLWVGNLKAFKCMYENMNADIQMMESVFGLYNLTAIDIICDKKYIKLLEYYLSIYEEISTPQVRLKSKLTTIQKVCEEGNISILSCLYSYFQDKFYVPDNLNLHFIHPVSKENCALIACRTLNYPLIKYLHEVCKADFTVLNSKGENAIKILISSNNFSVKHKSCFQYLHKTIGIPIPDKIADESAELISNMI